MCKLGVSVLSEDMKNETLAYILGTESEKIHAHEEFRLRQANSPLNEEKVRNLFLYVTGSEETAERAVAYFILEETRRKSNSS